MLDLSTRDLLQEAGVLCAHDLPLCYPVRGGPFAPLGLVGHVDVGLATWRRVRRAGGIIASAVAPCVTGGDACDGDRATCITGGRLGHGGGAGVLIGHHLVGEARWRTRDRGLLEP